MTPILLWALAAAPPPDIPPEPEQPSSWMSDEDYPAAAIRAGESGTAAIRLDVDSEGRVTGCTITASSGSATLDSATCRIMQTRARFRPARDGGKAVASTWSSRITWRLPEGGTDILPPPGSVTISFTLTPDGRVTGCSSQKVGAGAPEDGEAVCRAPESSRYHLYLSELAPRYRIVRIGFGAMAGVSPDAVLPPVEGELIQRRQVELWPPIGTDGPIRCRTLAAVGPDPFSADLCATLRARGETVEAEAALGREAGLIVDEAVRGIRRR
jgi:TonB family protein